MIRARSTVTNADSTVLALSLTTTVGEWRQIAEQLGDKHPSWCLRAVIRDAISKHLAAIDGEHEVSP